MISAGSTAVKLFTPADMAEVFGVTERQFMDWRRMNNWPCVRVGRTLRFTEAQLETILAAHTVTPIKPAEPAVEIAGQSKASAARAQRAGAP